MYHAIITKYHGPTDRLPARVSATTRMHSGYQRLKIRPYDHGLSATANHHAAAQALFDRVYGEYIKRNNSTYTYSLVGGDMPYAHEKRIVWVILTPEMRRSLCSMGSITPEGLT